MAIIDPKIITFSSGSKAVVNCKNYAVSTGNSVTGFPKIFAVVDNSSVASKKVGLVFDGKTTYVQLPLSVSTGKKVWTIATTLSTVQNTSSSYDYHQPCLVGIDTPGYTSDDFHIDTKNGNLFLFNGMGSGNDVGIDTGLKINDGAKHNIVLTSDGSKFTLYCDGKKLTESVITKSLDSSNPLTIGCSRPGECVFSQLTLYDFKFYDSCLADGKATAEKPIVFYEPDEADMDNKYLADKSGNNNNSQGFNGVITTVYTDSKTDTAKQATITIDTSRKLQAGDSIKADTSRTISGVISHLCYADTLRITHNGPIEYGMYLDTKVNIVVSDSTVLDTKRITSNEVFCNLDSLRGVIGYSSSDFDSSRAVENDTFKLLNNYEDTSRTIHRELSMSYGTCVCKEIDLGGCYDVEVGINIVGEGYAQVRYANDTHEYSPYSDYRPDKKVCRYIQVKILVRGIVDAANITVITSPKEITLTPDIPSNGTSVSYGVKFYKPPLVFPSASNFNVRVSDITNDSCFVKLIDDKGTSVAGKVSLLVKG